MEEGELEGAAMQSRYTLPVVLLSVVAAIVFAAQWMREQRQVYRLTIATASKDGEYYAFAQALATVVAQHQPRIQLTVLDTEGSQQNMELLAQEQVDLAIVQSDTPVKPSVRALAYLFPEVFHLIATADSGIEHVGDLRGKRVALMPQGSGSYTLFQPLRQHYGLAETDFAAAILPPAEAHAALQRGDVDALFRVIALGNPGIAELLETSPAKLVPIDQVASMQLSLPYLEATEIPKGTYNGAIPIPPHDLSSVGVRAVLMSHVDVNSSVIQQVTQALFEFRNELVTIYPRAATIRLPDAGENLGVPLHPGAKAYYEQDKPSFWIAYAEPIGLLLSVSVLCISGFWQFRLWLLERQKNRADMYNLEILELLNRVETIDNLEELRAVRRELFEIFHKVVVDLDKDRISPSSFQSFTFPWEVVITTIRHREVVLMNLRLTPEAIAQSHLNRY
jgi:TRAP transporter TAXI family solute receptor